MTDRLSPMSRNFISPAPCIYRIFLGSLPTLLPRQGVPSPSAWGTSLAKFYQLYTVKSDQNSKTLVLSLSSHPEWFRKKEILELRVSFPKWPFLSLIPWFLGFRILFLEVFLDEAKCFASRNAWVSKSPLLSPNLNFDLLSLLPYGSFSKLLFLGPTQVELNWYIHSFSQDFSAFLPSGLLMTSVNIFLTSCLTSLKPAP